ncbi:MAG: 4Fe-4S dicluster domain-containing protein [Gemmatimonadetes bacterium]|nr:4Fe-4S dicluster domain-containing protein [Gemmatimonadota bacterium]
MVGVDAAGNAGVKWAKVIDHTRCIGCHACTTACKSENEVPLTVTRTYVKYVDIGAFPQTRRAFQVTRCNQCDDAPCTTACPTSAMFRRPDGIVDFDKSICIGCKACIAACPYDAIFINPDDHSAEKCNFCAHRLDVGLEPACVVVCPTEAILVGDLNDPDSRVAQIVFRDAVTVRRPEKETRPRLFYKGAHQATLDPIAARRPDGGLFMWSEQGRPAADHVTSGHPGGWNSSAAAVLAYDIPHRAPWDWRVSLYTWTKGIAAGAYLVPILLVLVGAMTWTNPIWLWGAPVLAGVFLALTGGLLIWDLEHPRRFLLIFSRPQWRSWLVRGGFLISGYSLVLLIHFVATVAGVADLQPGLAVLGAPLAAMTAMYTAWLFAQAKARDLWQNPLAPAHLLAQAVLLGAAAFAPIADPLLAFVSAYADALGPIASLGQSLPAAPEPAGVTGALLVVVAVSSALHLLLLLGEATLTHATAHARLAAWEMRAGRFAGWYRAGFALVLAGCAAPWLGWPAAVAALAGVLLYEHACVQAGQAVPLA